MRSQAGVWHGAPSHFVEGNSKRIFETMRPAVENSKRPAYHPVSSGKTLENCALWRGSAIIGATASRHFA